MASESFPASGLMESFLALMALEPIPALGRLELSPVSCQELAPLFPELDSPYLESGRRFPAESFLASVLIPVSWLWWLYPGRCLWLKSQSGCSPCSHRCLCLVLPLFLLPLRLQFPHPSAARPS